MIFMDNSQLNYFCVTSHFGSIDDFLSKAKSIRIQSEQDCKDFLIKNKAINVISFSKHTIINLDNWFCLSQLYSLPTISKSKKPRRLLQQVHRPRRQERFQRRKCRVPR